MKKFIETIKNIFKIEELRKRIVYTLLLILVYRIGCFIVLPGIDATMLASLQSKTQEGLVGLLNMFSGGAFGNASIFALGVMPYISASIVIQLLGMFVPYFRKLQMEGESGRRKMNQITRYLTILILAIQCPAYLTAIHAQIPGAAFVAVTQLGWSNFTFNLVSTLILLSGSMFVMWLGERITDRGIGNGISLLIMIGCPSSLRTRCRDRREVHHHKRWSAPPHRRVGCSLPRVRGCHRHRPGCQENSCSVCQEGGWQQAVRRSAQLSPAEDQCCVMPIIFAQALMLFPILFSKWDATRGIAAALSNYTGFWYNLIFGFLVVIFTYFYTAVTVQPNMMAEQMKQNGGFIPGVKPGKKTAEYIDDIMDKVTLPGSIFLALIAIMPAFAMLLGVNNQFASFYGGTSLLILVGVILDTLQQIEGHLLMRHYDGLMKTGRLSGRSGM